MLPSRRQYDKWSLPSKWSFCAAVIGIPAGLISLLLTLWPLASPDSVVAERAHNLLKAAQELRYNHEWLTEVSKANWEHSEKLPTGSVRTEGVLRLVEVHHDWLLRDAYGEEKNMYQHILLLRDLSTRLGSPGSKSSLARTMRDLKYTLDDIHFLNNFLFWYISSHLRSDLSSSQLYSLGLNGLPSDTFELPDGAVPDMRRFVNDGEPIVEYLTYLGLID